MRLNVYRLPVVVTLMLTLAATTAAHGQAPPAQRSKCDSLYRPFWETPKGGEAWNACAVDVRPRPLSATSDAGIPHWSGDYDASITIVVNRDGLVDSASLQQSSSGGSMLAARTPIAVAGRSMATVRRLKFSPGMRGGTPVRTAVRVKLLASSAPDSLPAVAAWRYVVGASIDTMRLEWTAGAPLALENVDSAATVLLVAAAELRVTQMDFRDRPFGWNGCSTIGYGMPDAAALRERLRRSGLPLILDSRCPGDDSSYNVTWTALFRVSESKYLVRFAYPREMFVQTAGRCWVERTERAWRAGCG